MHKNITIIEFLSEDAVGLADQITKSSAFQQLCCDKSLTPWMLFWGPPEAKLSEIEAIFNEVPSHIPCAATSSALCVAKGMVQTARWNAVCIASLYMSPHTAYAELEGLDKAAGLHGIEECVDSFVHMLPKEYFQPGKMLTQRNAAHGVKYSRPAFLLLFTPGIGAESKSTISWPVCDKDNQLVVTLASKLGPSVTLFGGTAGSVRASQSKDLRQSALSWVSARPGRGSSRTMKSGIVGLLVETDLSFGCGCAHGFKPTSGLSWRVSALHNQQDNVALDLSFLRRSAPLLYHLGKLDPTAYDHIDLLDNPTEREAKDAPVLIQGKDWRTVVIRDDNEIVPNPPFKWKKNVAFQRPVPDGAVLYQAVGNYQDVLTAAKVATNSAIRGGIVRLPEAVLLANCRGRLVLLGEKQGAKLEIKEIRKAIGNGPTIFGMYCDGETCPSPRGVAMHWNWTAATLVLGSDFHQHYAAAARVHLLGQLDVTVSNPKVHLTSGFSTSSGFTTSFTSTKFLALKPLLEQLIKAASILMQVDGGSIRIRSDDGKHIELIYGNGIIYDIVPRSLQVAANSEDCESVSVRCYQQKRPVFASKAEYTAIVTNFDRWCNPDNGMPKMDVINKVQWWASFPVLEGGECLAVLSVHSNDPRFINESSRGEREASEKRLGEIASELAGRAAALIRECLMREALLDLLSEASSAPDPQTLARVIQDAAGKAIALDAHVLLMRPNIGKGCLEGMGRQIPGIPDDFLLKIGTALPYEKGICGWVYDEVKPFITDDVHSHGADDSPDGKNGRPLYRRLFDDVKASYVVPLKDAESSGDVLGVLCVEAKEGVLKGDFHLPMIYRIAKVCVEVIKKAQRKERQEQFLEALLPEHIVAKLGSMDWQWHFSPPARNIVTILYADIRGYTLMSQIVGEQRITSFITEYYDMVGTIVRQTEGTLDKFMGDGVIALYGIRQPVNSIGEEDEIRDKIERALDAGLRIAEGFQKLSGKWLDLWRRERPEIKKEHRFEIGAAVHTGKPIVGLFHSTKGDAGGHLTYTAIGKDMNIAARVGNVVDGNTLWITTTAWQFLRKSVRFDTAENRIIPANTLKGVIHDLQIFRVTRK